MNQQTKVYVPGVFIEEHVFQNGGSVLNVGMNAKKLIEFINANVNERGYVNIRISKRQSVGQYGDTHYATLNTFEKPTSQVRDNSQQSRDNSQQPQDDMPF